MLPSKIGLNPLLLCPTTHWSLPAGSSWISIPRTVNRSWMNWFKDTGGSAPCESLSLITVPKFGAHRIHEDGKWDSEFKRHLEKHGIKPILARVKHPQTNGKLERWFGEYKWHRLAFSSFEEFKEWYNNRPHGSLEFEHLETPERAFRRKMRLEMYFAIGHRLFGLWEEIWIIHTKWILSRCEILSGLYNSRGLTIIGIHYETI